MVDKIGPERTLADNPVAGEVLIVCRMLSTKHHDLTWRGNMRASVEDRQVK